MKIVFLYLFLVPIFGVPLYGTKEEQCGYQACPNLNPSELNVHLIAHSHDDVGWLKTVDEYYYGGNSSIQIAGVQHIITSVVQALLANPKRKFIQVESSFFAKWWKDQTPKKQDDVRKLINNGQFEIVGGGWSMNDESAAHYQSIIDQMTIGLKYMEDTVGKCARPKVGWQIDPFGHTREMASIFAQMGYDGLFFARLDWRDKMERLDSQTAEMLWRSSANFDKDSLLFTHAMYNHYSPPASFYFDILSEDDPLIPDEKSTEYNLKSRVNYFNEHIANQTKGYSSNNIMIAMGNDFTYQDAHYNYKNLDILIKAYEDTVQTDSKGRRIRLLYSTPGCYLKAVNAAKLNYKVKTDDFIPYATDYHSYWTGYYTSRPTQKRFERQGNNFLQMAKQLHVFSGTSETAQLRSLKNTMGVMQHHDAITGTEKQHVADDYARNFHKSFNNIHTDMNVIMKNLLSKSAEEPQLVFNSCILANMSLCAETKGERFAISVYNPLSRKVSHHVRLPVNSLKFSVQGPKGEIDWQILPAIRDFSDVLNTTTDKYDLVFLAQDLPALGFHIYYVTRLDDTGVQPPQTVADNRIGDENNYVALNAQTNFMTQAGLNGLQLSIRQELMYYIGSQGNNEEFKNRSSGAYIFRPDKEHPIAKSFVDNVLENVAVYKGLLVDEIHQTFNDWNKQIIRIYKNNENHIEFDWVVGPIDIEEGISKEIISRFKCNLLTADFYTDSNGREMLLRKNNYRPTYTYTDEEPVAGNYYPITSAISLRDNKERNIEATVLTDRAQGGASLSEGELELMVHRRLLKDDAFGVGEALNEEEFGKGLIVRGQHYLTFGSISQSPTVSQTRKMQRDIAQRKILAPWVFVADASAPENSLENLAKILNFEFLGLTRDLPNEVQILTLEPWSDDTVLIRFEHVLEIDEGGSKQDVDVKSLFKLFEITEMTETTLSGNPKETRLEWTRDGCLGDVINCDVQEMTNSEVENLVVTLAPMQIRTFVAKIIMV